MEPGEISPGEHPVERISNVAIDRDHEPIPLVKAIVATKPGDEFRAMSRH
jgi:hypothetical protein